jgi:Nicastrin
MVAYDARLMMLLPQPLVLAAATMDSSSMFHDLAFGAESAVSGTVALLAAAHALSKVHFLQMIPWDLFFHLL